VGGAVAAADAAYDLIVIGAGINGAGIARDAAMRGLRVLLLDKGDAGSGTTSWSTRLIHGGLRYLEHGEVSLVRESLRERERLLAIASHLVEPLPLLIPIYEGDRRGPMLIRVGMVAYDILSFDKSLPRHRMLDRDAALAQAPGLDPRGLKGAALYYDAQVEFAERLAVESMLDARACGADVLLYTEVTALDSDGAWATGIRARDVLTGDSFVFRGEAIVNVAGPWVDAVLAGGPTPSKRLIGGTKGSHIIVETFPGAPKDALYVEAKTDGRPYFIVPWNDCFLIGTTDERYTGDLDWVVASDDEIDYLLAETNRVIPGAHLDNDDVCWSYAGVRPLPHVEQGAAGAITRSHVIVDHGKRGGPRGLYSIVGGKLTTYRELAEQTVNAVFAARGQQPPPSRTGAEPLPGARGPMLADRAFLGAPARTEEHLRTVYGNRAADVMAMATTPDLRDPFDPWSGAIGAEVLYAVQREGARTLSDILARRTMVGLGPDVGIGADEAAAAIAARHLGWSHDKVATELASYRRYVLRYRPRMLAAGAQPSDPASTPAD
jgi:glycerol-3-phosphate dehydrogenase